MNDTPSDYDTYVGAHELISTAIGIRVEPMTEVEFMEACARTGYVHRSVIDMDAFEEAYQRS
jgi:hypothetical protein